MRVALALSHSALPSTTGIAVGVHPQLLTENSILAGSFAKLIVSENVSRIVQLAPVDFDAELKTVYLTPMLALRFDRGLFFDRFLKKPRPVTFAELEILSSLEPIHADRVYLRSFSVPNRESSITPTTDIELLKTAALADFFRSSHK